MDTNSLNVRKMEAILLTGCFAMGGMSHCGQTFHNDALQGMALLIENRDTSVYSE